MPSCQASPRERLEINAGWQLTRQSVTVNVKPVGDVVRVCSREARLPSRGKEEGALCRFGCVVASA